MSTCYNTIGTFRCPCKDGYIFWTKGCMFLAYSSVPEKTARFLSVFVLTGPVIPLLLSRIMVNNSEE